MQSPRGAPPASRHDRRPAWNAQPGRNARIAQRERGGRRRRGRRPAGASGQHAELDRSVPLPRGLATAKAALSRSPTRAVAQGAINIARTRRSGRQRRGRRPASASDQHTELDRSVPLPHGPAVAKAALSRPPTRAVAQGAINIARTGHGGRQRRGRRLADAGGQHAALDRSVLPPCGPPPADPRRRRPARNFRPERDARIAQLEHGARHRRARRLAGGSGQHAELDRSMLSPRGPPPAPPPAGVGPRGASVLSAMRASRSSNTACATVAPADWPAPVASTPSSIDPCRCRTGRRSRKRRFHARQPARLARAQSTLRRPGAAAANVAAAVRPVPATSTPSSTDPCCRRAGRHLRIPAAVGPRGTSVQSAMRASRSSNTARATVAPADYRTARLAHSVFDLAHAAAPPGRLRNPRTGAGFPHNHRSPRFIRFPQPTPLWKTARGRRSCDVDPSQRRFGPVDMWKTCVA
ncbi:hypothetical protein DRA46_00058 [Burkholderia gladioli]|nr:hypothetical protein [Burkholderia gladioli]